MKTTERPKTARIQQLRIGWLAIIPYMNVMTSVLLCVPVDCLIVLIVEGTHVYHFTGIRVN